MMADPSELLDRLHGRAVKDPSSPSVQDEEFLTRIYYVCRCPSNRAGVRLLMSCMLAKLDRPGIDPRKPYTEVGGGWRSFPCGARGAAIDSSRAGANISPEWLATGALGLAGATATHQETRPIPPASLAKRVNPRAVR